MKKMLVILISTIFLLSLGAIAMAQEKKPGVTSQRMVTARAKVEAVDPQNRMISLRGPKGNVVDLKVGEK